MKLKHLKKFHNYEKLNEEISNEQIVMVMQVLSMFSGQQQSPQGTISLQQLMNQQQQGDSSVNIEIGVTRTSEEDAYYNMTKSSDNNKSIQDNLPLGKASRELLNKDQLNSHYVIGTVGDFKKAVSDSLPTFEYFKYVNESSLPKSSVYKKRVNNLGTDITDYLKIGDQEINFKGDLLFDLSKLNDSTQIIASGNGLLLLIRTASNQQKYLAKNKGQFLSKNLVQMRKIAKGAEKFTDTDMVSIKANANKQTIAENIRLFFQMSDDYFVNILSSGKGPSGIALGSKEILKGNYDIAAMNPLVRKGEFFGSLERIIHLSSGGSGLAKPLDQAQRDENVIMAINGQLVLMNDFLIDYAKGSGAVGETSKLLSGTTYDFMSETRIKDYLEKFRSVSKEGKNITTIFKEQDIIVKEFLNEAFDQYADNFLKFVDKVTEGVNVDKSQLLSGFDIKSQVKKFVNQFINKHNVTDIVGNIPLGGGSKGPGTKKVETGKTDVKVGETDYKIRNRTIDELKGESFRYIKTFRKF